MVDRPTSANVVSVAHPPGIAPSSAHSPSNANGASTRRSGRKRRFLIGVIVVHVVGTIVARRKGYGVGGNTVVRCRAGHLFTTIWIPGASLKAVRLGWVRLQRCPVGKHWTFVVPVRVADLTVEERRTAAERLDVRIP